MGKNPTILSKTLRRLMDAHMVKGKPISANELSTRTGVPQSTITRILNGDVKDPRAKQVQRLADYLKVSIAELRGEATEDRGVVVKKDTETGYIISVGPTEMELITAYWQSDPTGQQAIVATVRALAAQSPRPSAEVLKYGKK
jgi:transcriptional regulator with XRE-family HTH domain